MILFIIQFSHGPISVYNLPIYTCIALPFLSASKQLKFFVKLNLPIFFLASILSVQSLSSQFPYTSSVSKILYIPTLVQSCRGLPRYYILIFSKRYSVSIIKDCTISSFKLIKSLKIKSKFVIFSLHILDFIFQVGDPFAPIKTRLRCPCLPRKIQKFLERFALLFSSLSPLISSLSVFALYFLCSLCFP